MENIKECRVLTQSNLNEIRKIILERFKENRSKEDIKLSILNDIDEHITKESITGFSK